MAEGGADAHARKRCLVPAWAWPGSKKKMVRQRQAPAQLKKKMVRQLWAPAAKKKMVRQRQAPAAKKKDGASALGPGCQKKDGASALGSAAPNLTQRLLVWVCGGGVIWVKKEDVFFFR